MNDHKTINSDKASAQKHAKQVDSGVKKKVKSSKQVNYKIDDLLIHEESKSYILGYN